MGLLSEPSMSEPGKILCDTDPGQLLYKKICYTTLQPINELRVYSCPAFVKHHHKPFHRFPLGKLKLSFKLVAAIPGVMLDFMSSTFFF